MQLTGDSVCGGKECEVMVEGSVYDMEMAFGTSSLIVVCLCSWCVCLSHFGVADHGSH